MAEEIAFENGRISNFERLVTLTLDWVILHSFVHHPSTSNYMINFIEILRNFLWTDGQTYARTYYCRRVDLTNERVLNKAGVKT